MPIGWGRRLLPRLDGAGREAEGLVHGDTLFGPTEQAHHGRPWVAANFVSSVDGRIAQNGSAAGLGSATDKALMRRIRFEADAVLHGAGTVRAERFTPAVPPLLSERRVREGRPPQPLGVLVAGNGGLPLQHPYFTAASPRSPRLIWTTDPSLGALARPGIIDVRIVDAPRVSLHGLLADLLARGVERVVCEGGPGLFTAMVRDGLIDEVFLTVAPRLLGDAPSLTLGALPGGCSLRPRSVYQRAGELFLRYTVDAGAG